MCNEALVQKHTSSSQDIENFFWDNYLMPTKYWTNPLPNIWYPYSCDSPQRTYLFPQLYSGLSPMPRASNFTRAFNLKMSLFPVWLYLMLQIGHICLLFLQHWCKCTGNPTKYQNPLLCPCHIHITNWPTCLIQFHPTMGEVIWLLKTNKTIFRATTFYIWSQLDYCSPPPLEIYEFGEISHFIKWYKKKNQHNMVYNFEEKIINTPCFFCRIHINPQMIFLMELCLFSLFLKLIQTIYKYAYTYMLFHILVLSIHNDSYIILFINLTMEYTLKILLLVHILG